MTMMDHGVGTSIKALKEQTDSLPLDGRLSRVPSHHSPAPYSERSHHHLHLWLLSALLHKERDIDDFLSLYAFTVALDGEGDLG